MSIWAWRICEGTEFSRESFETFTTSVLGQMSGLATCQENSLRKRRDTLFHPVNAWLGVVRSTLVLFFYGSTPFLRSTLNDPSYSWFMLQGGINYTLLQALLFKNFLNLFLYPAFCPHIDTFRTLLEIPIILFMSIRFLDTKYILQTFATPWGLSGF